MIDLAEDILGVKIDRAAKDGGIINIFCGMNVYGFRVDISPDVKPDLVADTHELSKHLDPATHQFLIAFGDPPYNRAYNLRLYGRDEDINYGKWSSEVIKFIRPGGLLIVYHETLPRNPDPNQFKVVARVGVVNRVGHGVRIAVFFQKYTEEEQRLRALEPVK